MASKEKDTLWKYGGQVPAEEALEHCATRTRAETSCEASARNCRGYYCDQEKAKATSEDRI